MLTHLDYVGTIRFHNLYFYVYFMQITLIKINQLY